MPQPFTSLNDAFGDVGSAPQARRTSGGRLSLSEMPKSPKRGSRRSQLHSARDPILVGALLVVFVCSKKKKKKLIVIFTDNAELIRANLLNMRKFELL